MFARYYTLLVGIAFLLAGIGGFLPVITQPTASDAPAIALTTNYGYLLGLFPINLIHNIIHLIIGATGLLTFWQYRNPTLYCRVLAIVLGTFTLMGLVPQFNTVGGVLPLFGHDIWLHGLEAVIAAYCGWLAPVQVLTAASAATYKETLN